MTTPGYVSGEGLYCRYKGLNSKRHLGEFPTERGYQNKPGHDSIVGESKRG